jgi:hypothetical protein
MSRHARDHCLAPERVDAPVSGGRYRSLFEELPRPAKLTAVRALLGGSATAVVGDLDV